MSYTDYGVLIKKNKKLVRNHEDYVVVNGLNIRFYYKNLIIGNNDDYHDDLWIHDLNSYSVEYPYRKFREKRIINGVKIDSKRIDSGDRYYTVIQYGEDLYEVIHGYGVNEDFELVYNKTNKLMNKLDRFMD